MKVMKAFIIVIGVVLLTIVIDLVSISLINRPIFAIKENGQENIKYKGLFFDTYDCYEIGKSKITSKWNKYTCPKTLTFEIIDKTNACDEALEEIYKDEESIYYLPCVKSHNISVKFSNGDVYPLKEVIENKLLTIEELQNNGLELYIEEIN